MSSPLELDPPVVRLVEGSTILDVACGRGKWGYLLRVNYWYTKNGAIDTEPERLVGVDLFIPFLRKLREHKVYDDLVACHVSHLPFRDGSFDTVIASEVIEHLERQHGYLMLSEIERICRRIAIVTTPNFLRKRGAMKTPDGMNPYEQHVTKWSAGELRNQGYSVHGVSLALSAFSPILAPIYFIVPQLSTHLVASKRKST